MNPETVSVKIEEMRRIAHRALSETGTEPSPEHVNDRVRSALDSVLQPFMIRQLSQAFGVEDMLSFRHFPEDGDEAEA